MKPLSAQEIQTHLGHVPGWTLDAAAIHKTFRFPSFPAAISKAGPEREKKLTAVRRACGPDSMMPVMCSVSLPPCSLKVPTTRPPVSSRSKPSHSSNRRR